MNLQSTVGTESPFPEPRAGGGVRCRKRKCTGRNRDDFCSGDIVNSKRHDRIAITRNRIHEGSHLARIGQIDRLDLAEDLHWWRTISALHRIATRGRYAPRSDRNDLSSRIAITGITLTISIAIELIRVANIDAVVKRIRNSIAVSIRRLRNVAPVGRIIRAGVGGIRNSVAITIAWFVTPIGCIVRASVC